MAKYETINDVPKRKKKGKLLRPELICGPGQNCKCSCNTAINLIHSILTDGISQQNLDKLVLLELASVHRDLKDI